MSEAGSDDRIRPRKRQPGAKDGGYVLAMSALLLVPLLFFTGLAVDLGSWYARAAQIQRATDAAALAGASALPRGSSTAEGIAISVARQNGFDNTDAGITVTAQHVPPDQMRVTIRDDSVPQYFTSLVNRVPEVARTSLAEYVPPVRMGSPRNYLGTGNLLSDALTENFWLAISSPCSSKENGDRIMTRSDGNWNFTDNPRPLGANLNQSNWAGCVPGGHIEENLEERPDGYFYAMRLEENYSGSVAIQVYDGAYCYNSGIDQLGTDFQGTSTNPQWPFTTTFVVRNNNAANPLEATPLQTHHVVGNRTNTGDCALAGSGGWRGGWRTLHTLTNPTRGTYYIQIYTTNPNAGYEARYGGSNTFALRAVENGVFSPCTSDPSDGAVTARSNCPNLFGIEHLGVSATIAGTTPSWFLADIGPEHGGKTLEIELWDAGEGAVALEVLDPTGDAVNFTWRVHCQVGDTPPTGGCGPGTTNILDLVGNTVSGSEFNPQPRAHRGSRSKYNDRLLILTVPLPANYTEVYEGRTWWKIRYTAGTASTDRTTWSVTVRGDPVRLIE